jgi:hypothetical protein
LGKVGVNCQNVRGLFEIQLALFDKLASSAAKASDQSGAKPGKEIWGIALLPPLHFAHVLFAASRPKSFNRTFVKNLQRKNIFFFVFKK